MFTTHDAMAQLVALRPNLTESERQQWFNKGSDAILKEVARISTPPVKEEKNDAASTVAKKGK